MKNILFFFGTRPEAIKMAPVVDQLKSDKNFRVTVAVSAQHRDMLDQVLKIFGLKSDIDLDVMRPGQTLYELTSRVLLKFEPVLEKIKPDLVLVHGDTTTTLAGTLAAYYKKIPVGHVEAGLRTGDRYRPFPEEMNRRVTDAGATLFFAPTNESKRNLLREGHNDKYIFVTGNTVIDALLETAARPAKIPLKVTGKVVLMTAHRRENFGAPFKHVFNSVRQLARRFPNVQWVYPVHPNPNVKKPAHALLGGLSNVRLMPPLDYAALVALMKRCSFVVTDSGGLQEEAPSLGKPVLVLRDVTERPEAVRAGTVRLVGTDSGKFEREVTKLLLDKKHYAKMANAVNPYGDGRAAQRIHQAIRWYFGMSRTRPATFRGGR